MSFDPSSYSNSDLMTSSHSGQSDMPFDPSSYSNYNLMTSYHAQPNAPFNPTSYNNSNLMMSSIGSYSNMAQVKTIPSEIQREQLERERLKLEYDKKQFKLRQEMKNNNTSIQSIIKSSACNYEAPVQSRQKSMKNVMDKKIGTKDTSVKPIIKSSVGDYLSEMDRKHVKKINNNHLTALMNAGDRAAEKGDFVWEMLYHRSVQETMSRSKKKGGLYQLEYRYSDPESKKAFGYNSCMIHFPEYTEYYYSLGYKFDDIFKQESNGPPGSYYRTLLKEYENDPKAVDYLNQSRAKGNRNQLDINNNAKSKPTQRGKRGGRKHKKNMN